MQVYKTLYKTSIGFILLGLTLYLFGRPGWLANISNIAVTIAGLAYIWKMWWEIKQTTLDIYIENKVSPAVRETYLKYKKEPKPIFIGALNYGYNSTLVGELRIIEARMLRDDIVPRRTIYRNPDMAIKWVDTYKYDEDYKLKVMEHIKSGNYNGDFSEIGWTLAGAIINYKTVRMMRNYNL